MSYLNCKKQNVKFVHCYSRSKDLMLVREWLASGKLQSPIDSTFKVKDMREAVKRYADRSKVGSM